MEGSVILLCPSCRRQPIHEQACKHCREKLCQECLTINGHDVEFQCKNCAVRACEYDKHSSGVCFSCHTKSVLAKFEALPLSEIKVMAQELAQTQVQLGKSGLQ